MRPKLRIVAIWLTGWYAGTEAVAYINRQGTTPTSVRLALVAGTLDLLGILSGLALLVGAL